MALLSWSRLLMKASCVWDRALRILHRAREQLKFGRSSELSHLWHPESVQRPFVLKPLPVLVTEISRPFSETLVGK